MELTKIIDLNLLSIFKEKIINLIPKNISTTTSLAVTEEGVSALDGTVGKVLNDKISDLSGKLSSYIKFVSGSANITVQPENIYDLNLYSYIAHPSGHFPICVSSLDIWGIKNIMWLPITLNTNDPKIRFYNFGNSVFKNTVQFTICFYKV